MKRCTPLTRIAPVAAILLTALSLGWGAAPAHAQSDGVKPVVRQFPKTAMRGELAVKVHPMVTLNGKSDQLSPGARIYNQNNLMVLPGQLAEQEVLVNYLRDGNGQIHQVWVLNSEEAKEKRPGARSTIFNFLTGNTPEAPGTTP